MKFAKFFCAALLTVAATSANATIIDFAYMANHPPGEMGVEPLVIDVNGDGSLMLTIHAYNANGEAYAYLDKSTGGLGVCGTLDANLQCNPGNDDNVTTGEYLTFDFSAPTLIDTVSFNNNHDGGFNASRSQIDVNGSIYTTPDYGYVTNTMDAPFGTGRVTSFYIGYADGANSPTQFYVQTMRVPEPAGIALFGIGLLGFGLARRAKR